MSKDYRNNLLALIHIAKKDLNMPRDAYEELVQRVSSRDGLKGSTSCKNLGNNQLVNVLNELKSKGWQKQNKEKTVKRTFTKTSTNSQTRYLYRLFNMLYEYRVIHQEPKTACTSWCKKYFGVDKPEWLNTDIDLAINRAKQWGMRVAQEREDDEMYDNFKEAS